VFLGFNQRILDQGLLVNGTADIIQCICSSQFILSRVFKHTGTQFIKTEKVGHIPLFIQHDIRIHHILFLNNQMFQFFNCLLLVHQDILFHPTHEKLIHLREVFICQRYKFTLEITLDECILFDIFVSGLE